MVRVTRNKTAAKLKVSKSTLGRMIKRGEINTETEQHCQTHTAGKMLQGGSTMASPPKKQIPWSEAPLRMKVQALLICGVIIVVVAGGFWGLSFLIPESGPVSAGEKQQQDAERAIEKNIEKLEKDTGKKLRPGKNIVVEAGHRYDGVYFVLAEYKPLLTEAGPIEDDMLEAYKAIYTLGLPVVNAEIVALADLVDSYGNEYEDPIYRSSMDGEQAQMVNWENLRNVNPGAVFSNSWRHPLVR